MQNDTTNEAETTDQTHQTLTLFDAAREIHAWQKDQMPAISDAAMIRRFPGLGSEKTYNKLRNGDASRLDLVNSPWLKDYLDVKAHCATSALGKGDDPIYSDLGPAKEVATNIKNLVEGKGTDRILIIQGGTGSGKTKALECAHALVFGSVLITADVMWQSLSAMLGDLCKGVGAVKDKEVEDFDKRISAPYRSSLLKRHLVGTKKKLILIDEAHHLNADGIDYLKGLINGFPNVYIVIAGMDTLWNRLTSDRWQQAKQIILNRGMTTLNLANPTITDARLFLTRRLTPEGSGKVFSVTDGMLETLCEEAKPLGAFAFLRRVTRKLLKDQGELDNEALANAIRLAKRDVTTNRRGTA